jgi:hypothetical protein
VEVGIGICSVAAMSCRREKGIAIEPATGDGSRMMSV